MKTEQWKAIPDYAGHYEVSDLGRVRSVDRVIYTNTLINGDIERIADLHRLGVPSVEVCAHFGVRRNTVNRIIRGERWPHLQELFHGSRP